MTNNKEIIHHPFHKHSHKIITSEIKRHDTIHKKIELKTDKKTNRNTTSTINNISTSTETIYRAVVLGQQR